MPGRSAKDLAEVIKKIPLFTGFSPTQIRLILGQCSSQMRGSGDILCKGGGASDEMFILVSGQLAVVSEDGLRLATISPVTTVGEMGVITGQPRSATVEVLKPSSILSIQKAKLTILRGHRDLKSRMFENVIAMLAQKLVRDNVRLRDFLSAKTKFEDDVNFQSRRLETALDLLEENGVDRKKAEADIAERMKVQPSSVMIVEDDPATLTALTRGLAGVFAVTGASGGREALDRFDKKKPDLVITDIKMPEMDGIALLGELRKRVSDLPVVAISGFVDENEMKKHPFDEVVEKPVTLADLRQLVNGILEKRQ